MRISDYFYSFIIQHQELRIHGFGRFEVEPKEAYVHPIDHEISPAGVKLSFLLDKDVKDAGFIKYCSNLLHKPEKEIAESLKKERDSWVKSLREGKAVPFKFLGQLKLNKGGTVVFVQQEFLSLDKRFFGMKSFHLEPQQEAKKSTLTQTEKVVPSKPKRKWGWWIAAASLVLILGASYWFYGDILLDSLQKPMAENTIDAVEPPEKNDASEHLEARGAKEVQDTLSTAKEDTLQAIVEQAQDSVVMDNPVPDNEPKAEEKPVETKPIPTPSEAKKYLVIAGCFQSEDKANDYLNRIREKGYPASIEGKTQGGLIRVCYASYSTWREAAKASREINQKEGGSSWVQRN
jgi:hypothetical protein